MSLHHCPTCDRPFTPEENSPSLPFCSDRCRQIDLGRWLDEKHGLPYESPHSPDDAPPHSPEDN